MVWAALKNPLEKTRQKYHYSLLSNKRSASIDTVLYLIWPQHTVATKDPKGEMNREHSLTLWFINWERRIRCRSHSIFTSLPKQKKGTQKSREIAAPFRSLVENTIPVYFLSYWHSWEKFKNRFLVHSFKFTILIFRNARSPKLVINSITFSASENIGRFYWLLKIAVNSNSSTTKGQ